MKESRLIIFPSQPEGANSPRDIGQSLDLILEKLDTEVASRQKIIVILEQELQRFRLIAEDKNTLLIDLTERLAESKRQQEGNRQLINKLLNDIERLNQDIEWYKKTYETRSLLGILRDKFKHFISRRK